jgi:hypothetical protein
MCDMSNIGLTSYELKFGMYFKQNKFVSQVTKFVWLI